MPKKLYAPSGTTGASFDGVEIPIAEDGSVEVDSDAAVAALIEHGFITEEQFEAAAQKELDDMAALAAVSGAAQRKAKTAAK